MKQRSHTNQSICHMQRYARPNAQGGYNAYLTAESDALPYSNGKVRAGSNDR